MVPKENLDSAITNSSHHAVEELVEIFLISKTTVKRWIYMANADLSVNYRTDYEKNSHKSGPNSSTAEGLSFITIKSLCCFKESVKIAGPHLGSFTSYRR